MLFEIKCLILPPQIFINLKTKFNEENFNNLFDGFDSI